MTMDFVNDATFWPALPCQECRAYDVPFCLDDGLQTAGACELHVGPLLKRLAVELRREVLVIRNGRVFPLPPDWNTQRIAGAEQLLDKG